MCHIQIRILKDKYSLEWTTHSLNFQNFAMYIFCSGSRNSWIFHMVSESFWMWVGWPSWTEWYWIAPVRLTGPSSKTVLQDRYRFCATVAPSSITFRIFIFRSRNEMTWILRAVMIVPPWKLGRYLTFSERVGEAWNFVFTFHFSLENRNDPCTLARFGRDHILYLRATLRR
jgi:hypothetical protein